MAAHALLGASSAHRWLECTPSARLEESMGVPDEGSKYAEEGTAAHAYAELECARRLGWLNNRSYAGRLKKHKTGEWWGPEMEESVGDYAAFVADLAAGLDAEGKSPVVELEQRVDYSEYVPGGFGTADAVILSEGTLHVIDLKYGKGVPVSAEGNPQLRLYALGAALKYRIIYGFDTVAMTIVQPRLSSASTDSVGLEDLLDWAETYVEPRARAADEGRGEFVPGEKQCRWCKAKAVCRARADAMLDVARSEFGVLDDAELADPDCRPDPELMAVEDIAALLPILPAIEAWAKDVQDYALVQARDHGMRFEGYKLVEGRSSRKIDDPLKAAEALRDMGYQPGDYYKPAELKTITALEKALGKAAFADVLGDLVTKPAGKPALVPVNDRRPEMGSAESAQEDFGEVPA